MDDLDGHLEGVPQPYLGDLLTMVFNHFLNGMDPSSGEEYVGG